MNNRKNILAATIGFFAGAGMVSGAMGQEGNSVDAETAGLLEEIVVTATKRETSLQDTAITISAIGGETIDKRNFVGMEDYLPSIPGVSMQDRGAGQNSVIIRGVGNGDQQGQTATGVYFGETPITGLGSTLNGDGAGSGDIKLVDIERVEVLRGPQGTLYGASSMGGTVRVIPNAPKLSEVEGKVAARYSQTGEQGGDNTVVQGMINLPIIEDKLAIRAVAYEFDNEGFIDNVAGSQPSQDIADMVAVGGVGLDRKAGGDNYTGFRLTTLWQPIDELSITLSYINQDIEQEGAREVNLGFPGSFQQARLAVDESGRGEGLQNEIDITNLILAYDLGWGSLFSSTSKIDYSSSSQLDMSFLFGEPRSSVNSGGAEVTIQELRFVSEFEGPLQVLLGYYYEDNVDDISADINSYGDEDLIDLRAPVLFEREVFLKQEALFGEFYYQLTDKLVATAGFRWFDYEKGTPIRRVNGNATSTEGERGTVDDINYKFNLAYDISDSTLIYGEWSEGFRFGRFQTRVDSADDPDGDGNGMVLFTDGVVRQINEGLLDSDTVENFELGVKTTLMDGRATLNASVFHIDWVGIPISLLAEGGGNYFFNAGESKSEGVELEVQALLSDSLILNLSSSYIETALTEDAPSLGGEKGDNIQGSADFNFNVGLEHQFTVGQYDSFVRADYLYVSEYYSVLAPDEDDIASGGYGLLDLKAGITVDNIELDLFVKNLSNADDFTWVENVWSVGRANRLRPRTIGFNVAYSF